MGKDFPFDPRRQEAPAGFEDEPVDKRNMRESHRDPERTRVLRSRKVEGGKNFDAAESVDKANAVLERLAERGVIEFKEEPELELFDQDAGADEPAGE